MSGSYFSLAPLCSWVCVFLCSCLCCLELAVVFLVSCCCSNCNKATCSPSLTKAWKVCWLYVELYYLSWKWGLLFCFSLFTALRFPPSYSRKSHLSIHWRILPQPSYTCRIKESQIITLINSPFKKKKALFFQQCTLASSAWNRE